MWSLFDNGEIGAGNMDMGRIKIFRKFDFELMTEGSEREKVSYKYLKWSKLLTYRKYDNTFNERETSKVTPKDLNFTTASLGNNVYALRIRCEYQRLIKKQ